MADVSIILVNWNANVYLINCLRALARDETSPDLEIIVVDNGSTDGGPEAVEAMFPEITLIRNGKNLGFATANNIGIRASTCRYVFLLNTDTEVVEGCLASLVRYADDHANVAVIGPQLLNRDGSIQVSCGRYPTPVSLLIDLFALQRYFPKSTSKMWWDSPHNKTEPVPAVGGSAFFVRRDAMDEVGLLDECFFFYGEETDWCKRFTDADWQVHYFCESQVFHFVKGSSRAASIRFNVEYERSRLHYWRKHFGLKGRIYSYCIITLHHVVRLVGRTAMYILVASRREEMALKMKSSAACLGYLVGISKFS